MVKLTKSRLEAVSPSPVERGPWEQATHKHLPFCSHRALSPSPTRAERPADEDGRDTVPAHKVCAVCKGTGGRKRKEREQNNVTGSVKAAGNYLIAQVRTGD